MQPSTLGDLPGSVSPAAAESPPPAAPVAPSSTPSAPASVEGDGSKRAGPTPPAPNQFTALTSEACALALASCLVGSIPAGLRAERAGGSLVGGWLASTAIVFPLVLSIVMLSHTAGRGFRMLTGNRAGRSTASGLALWIGLTAPILMVLGTLLKNHTNHRGLGGAAFGVTAVVVAVLMALVAGRIVETGRWLVARGLPPQIVAGLVAAIALGPVVLLSLPLLRGQEPSPETRVVTATLVDLAIFIVASALVVAIDLTDVWRARARRFGLMASASVFVVGASWLSGSQSLGAALRAGGGLAATMVAGLEGWTDRDRDGAGAYFGGRDCDEGDPRVHPGALDAVVDGVDQDCDGTDGPVGSLPEARAGRASASPDVSSKGSSSGTDLAVRRVQKPSIVLVTLDSVRADHTSLHGYAKKTTPRLEALASRGTVFEHAYAAGTDTQHALAPILSGVRFDELPRDHREWPTIKPEAELLAERLKKGGYATAAVSAFTWISKERGFAQGFDQFVEVFGDEHPERGVTGPLVVRSARAILEKNGELPLFLWVHLFDAHEQYKKHDGLDFGKGDKGLYDGEVAFVDGLVGDLAAAVEASKRSTETAIIVHGSQGEGFGEHDSSGHGREVYEETLRVPLVVALPTAESHALGAGEMGARRYTRRAVSMLDLAPTVLDLAGLGHEGLEGKSLLEIARGREDADREPVYARGPGRAAIVDWPLKIVVKVRKGKHRFILFDLALDPGETKDVSDRRPADLARLQARFEAKEKVGAARRD